MVLLGVQSIMSGSRSLVAFASPVQDVKSVGLLRSESLSRREALPGNCRPLQQQQQQARRRDVGVVIKARAGGGISDLLPFLKRRGDKQAVKEELLLAIGPLDRGAAATPEDRQRIDEIAKKLEALNPTKEPLKSPLVNGKWQLLYTTSQTILKSNRPKLLRPNGPIYQAINADTLRAQNVETWPFFNQVTANLAPANSRRVVVNFDYFKIAGLIRIKAPGRARGELEITYLDDELRVSRGDKGNLFVLKMVDPSYRVPA